MHYQQWEVGLTRFDNLYYPAPNEPDGLGGYLYKDHIVDIKTFEGEFVEMPEDCTGLFSNMSLGFDPECNTVNYEFWNYRKENESDPWEEMNHNKGTVHSARKVKTIDFSNFDFSKTKNMSSLF